jgi:glycosyltransferase involved in cell wall biosynthesis
LSSVSIIMAAFNAATWIREAIDSCRNQTHRDIEIVVVDDGSTDDTLEILRAYGSEVIWETGPNQGACRARNRAFALSSGRYIQYLDADDYLLPVKIERQLAFLEQTGADVVYGDWRHQYEHLDGSKPLGEIVVSGVQNDVLEALLSGWWTANMTLLLRRETVSRCAGWDETLRVAQDRDFFISVAMTGADIRYQPGCYSVYRRYGDVTLSTSSLARWLEGHEYLLQKAESELARAGRLSAPYRRALAESYFHIARNYHELDGAAYARLLNKTLSLWPAFRPKESASYNLAQRVFGFAGAERLASFKRRVSRTRRTKGTLI